MDKPNPDTALPQVLVVDDDEIILLALRESLTPRGYEVHTTNNPLEGLKLMAKNTYAIVISDQRMAEMNGLDFLSQCKTIQPETARILITGVQNIKTLIRAINESEVFRFVGKPWVRDDLLKAIADATQHHRLLTKSTAYIRELEARLKDLSSQPQSL